MMKVKMLSGGVDDDDDDNNDVCDQIMIKQLQ